MFMLNSLCFKRWHRFLGKSCFPSIPNYELGSIHFRIIEHMKKGVTMGKGKSSGGSGHEEKFSGSKMDAMAKTLPFLAMPNDEKKDVVKAEDKVGRNINIHCLA